MFWQIRRRERRARDGIGGRAMTYEAGSVGIQLEEEIERYIDRHGMIHLLIMIENICDEKADHCDLNW
jgi:hypothetical protein